MEVPKYISVFLRHLAQISLKDLASSFYTLRSSLNVKVVFISGKDCLTLFRLKHDEQSLKPWLGKENSGIITTLNFNQY